MESLVLNSKSKKNSLEKVGVILFDRAIFGNAPAKKEPGNSRVYQISALYKARNKILLHQTDKRTNMQMQSEYNVQPTFFTKKNALRMACAHVLIKAYLAHFLFLKEILILDLVNFF